MCQTLVVLVVVEKSRSYNLSNSSSSRKKVVLAICQTLVVVAEKGRSYNVSNSSSSSSREKSFLQCVKLL